MHLDSKNRYRIELQFLNITSGQIEDEWLLNKSYNSIHLSDEGSLLICSAGSGECVDIYDFQNRQLVKTFKTDFAVYNAKLSTDKSLLICAGYNDSILIFDFLDGHLIKKIKTKNKKNAGLLYKIKDDSYQISDFALTKDNKYLAVCEHTSNGELNDYNNHYTKKNYKGSLLYFELVSEECLNRLECGDFLQYIHLNESNQSILTVDNNSVGLMHYIKSQNLYKLRCHL